MRKYYSGKYKIINREKYLGDPDNIIYRSSWELKCLLWFDKNDDIVSWSSEELIIPYISPVDGKPHRYFPDFFVKSKTKKGIKTMVIEIKPYKQTIPPKQRKKVTKLYITEVATWGVNQAKWEAAKEYCSDRKWEFKILTEHDLNFT
jgi:hypothetical protein